MILGEAKRAQRSLLTRFILDHSLFGLLFSQCSNTVPNTTEFFFSPPTFVQSNQALVETRNMAKYHQSVW
jgi:hypothetical protein